MSLPQNKRFAARRLLCLLLALAFGLALAGCGSRLPLNLLHRIRNRC